MSSSTLSSFFDYAGGANPYTYKPDPSVSGGGYDFSKSIPDYPGKFEMPEWLKDKNPYAYEPGTGETKGKSFLDKFAGALDKYSNKSVNPGSQQEKEKERAIATPSSIGGGNIQKLTDNFTALYPQTFSPFTVAGVEGRKGVLGSILAPIASAATSLIPGVGPLLAPIAGAAVSSFG
jgi:hypothetical protein